MWGVLDDRDSGVDERPDNEGSLSAGDDLDGAPPAIRVGPDGAPIFDPIVLDSPPPFAPEHCPCLRGPCRYFWQLRTHFDHGNAAGTLEQQPRFRRLLCTAQDGVYLSMSADAPVLECDRWDPLSERDQLDVEARRTQHYEANPDHHPDVVAEALEAELDAAEMDVNEPTYEEILDGASDDGSDSRD